jgi:hypothetical protein
MRHSLYYLYCSLHDDQRFLIILTFLVTWHCEIELRPGSYRILEEFVFSYALIYSSTTISLYLFSVSLQVGIYSKESIELF